MNYCSHCGQAVSRKVPAGDTHERWVCGSCGRIHYQNPLPVVGCIPERDGKILLCKRAIEPRYGYWTVPAGFMELGESTAEGAKRETLEEACAEVAEVLRIHPKLSLERLAKSRMYKNKADSDRVHNALRKAGIPEKPPK